MTPSVRHAPRMWVGLSACLGAVLLGGCVTLVPQSPPALASGEPALERQILLTVPQASSSALSLLGDPSNRYVMRRGYGAAPSVERTLNQLARTYGIRRLKGWPIASLDVYCEIYVVGPTVDVDALLERLARDPRVDIAQPMHAFETLTSRYDDPYVDLQESVTQMSTELAHDLATGRGVTVAIIDSQVDAQHPDLKGRVTLRRDLVADHRVGGGGELHGTAVAGIIASSANNREGIVGVAPDVSIAALRACWTVPGPSGGARCSTFSLAQALELAMNIGPGVINLSLAGPHDPLLAQLLDKAIERGIVVVAATPDAPSEALAFPASHARVIAARSSAGTPAQGIPFVVDAPGTEIITTTPDAGYAFLSGNSLAAAHVTGVVALLLERNPRIDVDLIVQLLTDTTTAGRRGFSINACEALAALTGGAQCRERSALSF